MLQLPRDVGKGWGDFVYLNIMVNHNINVQEHNFYYKISMQAKKGER